MNKNESQMIKDIVMSIAMSQKCGDDGEGTAVSISEDDGFIVMRRLPESGDDEDVNLRLFDIDKDSVEGFVQYVRDGDMIGGSIAGPTGVLAVWRTPDGGYRGNVRRCGTIIRKHRTDNAEDIANWIAAVWPLLALKSKCKNFDVSLFHNLPDTDKGVRRGAVVETLEDGFEMLQVYPSVAVVGGDMGVMLWITEDGRYAAAITTVDGPVEETRAPTINDLRAKTSNYWLKVQPAQGRA